MAIVCNRLDITRKISERTPLVVIKEIMKAHWINFQESSANDTDYIRGCIKAINSFTVYSLNLPLSNNSFIILKRYLNVSEEDWTEGELLDIFKSWANLSERLSNNEVIPI